MPIPANGQVITINASNSGQVYEGNSNTFTVSPGQWTTAVYGAANDISGGDGPDTYVLSSTAQAYSTGNNITTGTSGSYVSITGDYTTITVPNAQTVSAAIVGNYTTISTSDGTASVVAFGDHNQVNGGNGNGTFLLSGEASGVLLGSGTNAVGMQGDGLIDFGVGPTTFAFLAGSASSATGPVLFAFPGSGATFNPAIDHISILLSTGYSLGLTDTGLSPQAFLTAAQFTEGGGAASPSTRFVYNPSTGQLSYTPYGSDSAANIPVAQLPTGIALSANDIFISNRYAFTAPVQNALDSLPASWGVTDPLPTAANPVYFTAQDVTTGVNSSEPGVTYTGPVTYLTEQLSYAGTHNIVFHAQTNNVFMQSGSGEDALQALGGNNVLDGGTGSNFLVGGTGADGGTDTFFTDARGAAGVFNTVVNFHPGDMVTVYGYTPGSSYAWTPSDGAPGYMGLTLNASIPGNAFTKVTLAGLTPADLSHLAVSTGTVSGIPYLAISNT